MITDPRSRNILPGLTPNTTSVYEYLILYVESLQKALSSVEQEKLQSFYKILKNASQNHSKIYVAGNGGSAAISDHLCCDWLKGTYAESKPVLNVQSLMSNVVLLTALANDFGYEKSIARQIEMLANPKDVLVLISSSGNSANILEAAKVARLCSMITVGLTGFDGGELQKQVDLNLHIPVRNYGIVEDSHQILMHVLAQFFAFIRENPRENPRENS